MWRILCDIYQADDKIDCKWLCYRVFISWRFFIFSFKYAIFKNDNNMKCFIFVPSTKRMNVLAVDWEYQNNVKLINDTHLLIFNILRECICPGTMPMLTWNETGWSFIPSGCWWWRNEIFVTKSWVLLISFNLILICTIIYIIELSITTDLPMFFWQ